MRKAFKGILLLASCEAASAQMLGYSYQLPSLEVELVAIEVSSTLPQDRLAIVGGKAIVRNDSTSASAIQKGLRESAQRLFVIRRPKDGVLGVSDGSILLSVKDGIHLDSVIAEHGLSVDRIFSTGSIALIRPIEAKQLRDTMHRLVSDPRVHSAELNSNYQLFSPN